MPKYRVVVSQTCEEQWNVVVEALDESLAQAIAIDRVDGTDGEPVTRGRMVPMEDYSAWLSEEEGDGEVGPGK
jgi:hypothetical protein